jgi:hypothetical protein
MFLFVSTARPKDAFRASTATAKPGDNFPIKVHISGIHYREEYIGAGQTEDVIYADAVMNGKKVELRGIGRFLFSTTNCHWGTIRRDS